MNYFITEYYLKTATTISQNVDIKDVNPFINMASELFIKDILNGPDSDDTFYNTLLSAYTNQTLTADEITLVSKIKPALAWRTATLCLPSLWIQVKNKGPQTQLGEFSQSITASDMNLLKNEFENYAEEYQDLLIKYLRKYCDLFPLFPGLKRQYKEEGASFNSGVAKYDDCSYYDYWDRFKNIYY